MVVALAAFASSAMALDNEPKDGMSYQAFLGFTASKIRGLDGYDGKVGGTAGFKVEYVLPTPTAHRSTTSTTSRFPST